MRRAAPTVLMSEGRFFHTPNVVTIVAWAGVGKSTLVNHWLRRMATDHYRSAELIFGWSFYRQGRARDSRSSSRIFEPYWFWTAWSRSKIRLVHRKAGYGSLPSRRFCGTSLPSIRGFA